ncbi:MAG: biopolymer transporter ExbD, partial [Bacteroidota bacterium]
QTPNTVTVILIAEKEWYCYSGTGFTNGKTYSSKDFRILLTQKKKQWGDSLFVIIKPEEQASYKATVDALDEMILNKIERYAMARLNLDEKSFLDTDNQESGPPEPISITTPGSVSTSAIPDDNAFLIEIRKDNSVWYQPISPLIKMAPQKVNAPIIKNLKKIIADYEKASPDKKKTYLIKGDGNATYLVFEQVIAAMKENNIYKYTLVTSEN